ncbi:hypothetical protein D9V30_10305 [Mycetocola reblochoni]|uniref:Phage protein n=2 Tax=Mycetocola reblochoni TaxID=331618 RepID=A0A1R4JPS6_9MICO|nr:hypothetical protein [Mycetocola reblochoni]RLP68372.1 hypothetical protein D9V30_10305 [Mycetocola reblochoni]SJN34006.1 Phage protein [Mycetocola reblochoni REB411]
MSETLALLERAHAHLTELRDATSRNGWQGIGYFQHWGGQNQNGDYAESILFDQRGEPLVYGLPDAHGDLIVALHRTIDAQLAILAADIELGRGVESLFEMELVTYSSTALARAVLGEEA